MDLPIVGTVNFTPTGLFLFFAAALAVVYFGWQLFGTGRAGRDVKEPDAAPHVGADSATAKQADDEGAADSAHAPTAQMDKDDRAKD